MDLQQMARDAAAKWGLDPALVCAVCDVESGWNPWLSRYEPAFFHVYLDKSRVHLEIREFIKTVSYTVTFDTELRERSFSRGLMQVIGQVARERGFKDPLPQLHDPVVGLEVGCRNLKRCLDRSAGNTQQALIRWNGSVHYPDKVFARMEKYGTA